VDGLLTSFTTKTTIYHTAYNKFIHVTTTDVTDVPLCMLPVAQIMKKLSDSDQKTQFLQEPTFGPYSKPVESSPNPP